MLIMMEQLPAHRFRFRWLMIILIMIHLIILTDMAGPGYGLTFHSNSGISDNMHKTWWEVQIVLDVTGNYEVKEGASLFQGEFDFKIEWKGFMEEDDGDFLLYRDSSELRHWSAKETSVTPESTVTLNTEDFTSAPVLFMNYILKEKKALILDLFVDGFSIPQNPSLQKIPLILPASAENINIHKLIDYDTHIQKGSNAITFPEKKMSRLPFKKVFFWIWKYQGWQNEQKIPIFLSTFHTADVEITIDLH